MSELYGRQVLFIGTYAMLTAFNAGAAGAPNIQSLLILRFFAGAFGSSPLTNAGGVIADMFPASQRGLAMSVFAAAPFLGPTLGECNALSAPYWNEGLQQNQDQSLVDFSAKLKGGDGSKV
jgi:MFS family permease